MIELINATKYIGKNLILDDINLKLEKNHVYGLRGANGSGKTMLLRMISGLMKPTKGEVIIDGKKLYDDIQFPESIGVLIENPSFIPGIRGRENLEIIAGLKYKDVTAIVKDAIEKVGLTWNDKRKYRKYSLGMKQRLGIAAAIMGGPDIIILDEPFNALDPAGIELVKKALLELKKDRIIIVACHDREELELVSDEIFMMRAGRIEG